MFGEDRRLIVSNRRLAAIHGLSPELLQPGSTLEDIKRLTIRTDICSRDSAENTYSEQLSLIAQKERGTLLQELSDGRVISILHQPMSNEGWVATYDDITERHHAEVQMAHMARHPRTGLPNRILFVTTWRSELARCQRHQRSAVVFCLDLDHFKNVNDTLGRSMGDRLLREVAARITTLIRREDTVARLGGDEFVILQADVTQPADVDQLCPTC